MMEHDNVRKKNVYMYGYWDTLLYNRKLTEHCKPAIMEKIKIIINEKRRLQEALQDILTFTINM